MKLVAGNPYAEAFDSMTPQRKTTGDLEIRVLLAKNVPPRDPQFEYIQFMGADIIERIFASKTERADLSHLPEQVFMCFPERSMSVHEQRWFTTAIERAIRPTLRRVDILTSSVFVVQCADALAVFEDDKYLLDTQSDEWWFGS